MNYFKIFLNSINPTVFISIIALVVSIIGISISAWNITIYKRSYYHALIVQENRESQHFEELKLEILNQIADDIAIMGKYYIEIFKLHQKFDAEPQSVQDSMINSQYAAIKYSNIVGVSLANLNLEWQEIVSYQDENDYKKLILKKADLYRDYKTNIILKHNIQQFLDVFYANLQKSEKKNKVLLNLSSEELASRVFSSKYTGIPKINYSIKLDQKK